MERNDNNNKLNTGSASQSYIDLATLLQKTRSPEKKLQVEKILRSDMPVHVMIEHIEQVDNDYKTGRPRPAERMQEEIESTISSAGLTSADRAEKNRKNIKSRLRKNDTLSFIFYDFRKILHFIKNAGRKSDYIRHSFFPPGIHLNRRIQHLLETVFQKQAGELYLTLNKVLKEGWLHLTKLEYNLIVQFTALCSEILNVNFLSFDLKDENIIDKMNKLETLFITCHYRQEYPATIISAVTTVIERYPEWNIDPFAVKNNIIRLLDQKQSRPSLQNLILAMNMIKYKRYVSFNDLFQSGMMDIINTFDFECDIITSRRIKEYSEKTLGELLALMKEKVEIDKLVRFLPLSPDGSFNYKILELFYEKSFQKKNFDFTKDREFPALLSQKFLQLFLEMYEQFLSGKLEMESGSSVKIFSTGYFQIEISKIHSLIEKLAKYAYVFEKFPDERYLALVNSKKAGTQTEVELVQLIKDFITVMKSLADKLMDIERCHRPEHQAAPNGEDIPLEPSMLLKRIVRVPHWDERVAAPPHLRGQQIMAILSDIITLCLITVVFFHDREIPLLLAKKDRIHRDIHGFRLTLERITNIIEMKSIEGKYGI